MKSSRELFGFDDRPWLVFAIVSTAILFPLIFLGMDLSKVVDPYSVAGGIIYAGTMFLVNRAIIFHYIERRQVEEKSYLLQPQLLMHFSFTISFALFMTWLFSFVPNSDPLNLLNALRNIFGCLILLGITAGIYEGNFWFRKWKASLAEQERLRRENIESQLETLKNQVNPHFLFNSLNTLASVIPEDPQLGVEYVQKLSKVYRYILLIKDKKLVSLDEELECIEAYMFMLKIRFGSNFRINLDTDKIAKDLHIVPLSIQLLVENAVKHNVISNKKPLLIEIFPSINNAEGHVSESANGTMGDGQKLVVRNKLQLKSNVEDSTGTGLENIRSRYDMLTGRAVDVIVSEEYFTVAIPLVHVESY